MSLTVLSVAYPFAVVGPCAVGGAESILTTIEAELVRRGHRSVVVARDGSACAGRLLPTVVPEGVITDAVRREVVRRHQAGIDRALRTEEVDVVHMHGLDFDKYLIPGAMPILVTLHLPPSWYPEAIWKLPANYRLQCVSETQRQACPAECRERVEVIGNGVELPALERLPARRKYAVMLSRICPEKNLHAGIDAAHAAGVPVVLAGEVFPYEEHLQYFRGEIEPRLGEGVRFVGAVGGAEKTRLLARARCLLLPTLAPETSSLVAMEAMAVGTPVVAYRPGAIPEVVQEGRTGFLVSDVAGMAAAIGRVEEIDGAVCRSVAAERFSFERMSGQYLALYERLRVRDRSVKVSVRTEEELRCSVLKTTEELERMEGEWRALWRLDDRATPFQSPEWLISWWKRVGEGELFVVLLRSADGELRAMLPMYIYTQPEGGERHLLLLGAGTSDYLDGVFGETREGAEQYAGLLLEELQRHTAMWDRAFLHQIRESSPLVTWARCARRELYTAEPCSSVPVEGWERLPAKIRLNSGRYIRRAEARGRVRFCVAETAAEAVQAFERLVGFHGKRWAEGGVLRPCAVQAHHRDAVPKLLEAGLLWMLSMEMDGRTIGVLYVLVDPLERARARERRIYSYLVGFDPEFGDLSPGTLLLSRAFDRCRAEGVGRMDLLRGDEGYKRLWGASEEPTFGFALDG